MCSQPNFVQFRMEPTEMGIGAILSKLYRNNFFIHYIKCCVFQKDKKHGFFIALKSTNIFRMTVRKIICKICNQKVLTRHILIIYHNDI